MNEISSLLGAWHVFGNLRAIVNHGETITYTVEASMRHPIGLNLWPYWGDA